MIKCDAKILWIVHWIDSEGEDRIAECKLEMGHVEESHVGVQLNPVTTYDGSLSETTIHWLEDDRRTFRGQYRHCKQDSGCVLPDNHMGRHAQ